MTFKEGVKRYIVFFIGLFFNAFGVAFTTRALLGASPIAAIPYSLSLIFPRFTMGNYIIVFNILLVLLQWIILRGNANKVELALQVVMVFAFGYCTDFSNYLLRNLVPGNYAVKLLLLVIGCGILAFGVYFELIGDVVMLPGNAFPKAVAEKLGKEYGPVRMTSDITMTVIAAVLCLIFLKKLSGVREGTIIAAFLVGNIVTLWNKLFARPKEALQRWIKGGQKGADAS
ncbi:MAG: YitT family protein [Firmicutes bacterium]|nr:YitT family protein [Bacillota bacterium]